MQTKPSKYHHGFLDDVEHRQSISSTFISTGLENSFLDRRLNLFSTFESNEIVHVQLILSEKDFHGLLLIIGVHPFLMQETIFILAERFLLVESQRSRTGGHDVLGQ